MVGIQWHHGRFYHETLNVLRNFDHLLKLFDHMIWQIIIYHLSWSYTQEVGRISTGSLKQQSSYWSCRAQLRNTLYSEMKWRVTGLVLNLKFWFQSQKITKCKFRSRVAGPVKWCATSVVDMVYVHTFEFDEVVERCRLVSLCGNVQNICSIHVPSLEISMHLFYKYFNNFIVAVISCKVQRREIFISRLVGPSLKRFDGWFFVDSQG